MWPSTAAVMSGVPGKDKGAAAGMRNTLWSSAQTAGFAISFTMIIGVLALTLPTALSNALIQAGAPQPLKIGKPPKANAAAMEEMVNCLQVNGPTDVEPRKALSN